MLVAVASVKGSPGVTTLALALASRWPRWSVLLEADPSGGDLAWRFALDRSPGLLSFVAAARHDTDPRLLWRHAQEVPGPVAVVAAPPDASRSRRALVELLDAGPSGAELVWAAARTPGSTVVVDCGRLDETSPVLPVVKLADAVVVVTGARSDALVHLVHGLPMVQGWNAATRLVLVGAGHAAAEVERELGSAPLGHVPDDPYGAAVLAGERVDSRRTRRGWNRSDLGRAVGDIAAQLTTLTRPGTGSVVVPATEPARAASPTEHTRDDLQDRKRVGWLGASDQPGQDRTRP